MIPKQPPFTVIVGFKHKKTGEIVQDCMLTGCKTTGELRFAYEPLESSTHIKDGIVYAYKWAPIVSPATYVFASKEFAMHCLPIGSIAWVRHEETIERNGKTIEKYTGNGTGFLVPTKVEDLLPNKPKESERERHFSFMYRRPGQRVMHQFSSHDIGEVVWYLEEVQSNIPIKEKAKLDAANKLNSVLPNTDKVLADWYEGDMNYWVIQHVYYFDKEDQKTSNAINT